jgi:hypothetical protein
MSNELQVKDRVVLTTNNREVGIIVASFKGRFKVLWDKDWDTGRTYLYIAKELNKALRV